MAKLEEIIKGTTIKGILPDGLVHVVDVKWIGSIAIELTYKDSAGRLGNELIYREREQSIEIAQEERPWSFDGDGFLFRLVSEARRIRLAYLFDPMLAVHTSMVEPLPHQITAVYGELLPRQPLRFLLADDPGSGKTIMAGLFIKELIARGDLQKCLIICPGNLVEQWQDELDMRFHLPFSIMTNDALNASRTGNWFNENPFAICRLDKLSRDDDLLAKLGSTDWDLIICDEAHKMSAHFFSGEVSYTKRYRLGQMLSSITRHFLLLTATPHNGKEEDFQLFMALLDEDRFEGRFRDGVHSLDASDLMRRLVKEQLLKFDGTPLFPERIAYTANYSLSEAEGILYKEVTDYVREEFNRAEKLSSDGRKGTVGFALTVLQRRLASSPEAIYQSLRRRRERLEKRLREERLFSNADTASVDLNEGLPEFNADDIEDADEMPDEELEQTEEKLVDQASAARTIVELQAEINKLKQLEAMALEVRQSASDRKWEELSSILQSSKEMFDAQGHRRKLIVFTEHRDTLNYLNERIAMLLGKPEAVVIIHGSLGREQRKKAESIFTQDKSVEILLATDAAGEGINLQRAHLMVNYDLPWNPNRLEQRFGRIHRIGQTEVCHLWNLVAKETREGEVYSRLLEKLEEERRALGGQVFDVLGRLTFDNKPLRDLLLEAIRYGERPDVRERLTRVVDQAMDRTHLRQLLEERALARDAMDTRKVQLIREDMERAEARRLQPHFVASFFLAALKDLGGTVRERETKRFEITHVPAAIRNRDRSIGTRTAVLSKYERITFEKELVTVSGKPVADFVCPGHPLLDATIDLVIERYRDLLKRGTILVDETDFSDTLRYLVTLEHSIQDARTEYNGQRRLISKELQFVEIDAAGTTKSAGYAPYLDYRPLLDEETTIAKNIISGNSKKFDIENQILLYAARNLIPRHLEEVKKYKEELIDKTSIAVKNRLQQEILFWDSKAQKLGEEERSGKINARLNSSLAKQRADDLSARLQKRLSELEQERKITPLPPVLLGGAIVIPIGLLNKLRNGAVHHPMFANETKAVETAAMNAVMQAERTLGFVPKDISNEKRGYDIESQILGQGRLRFIEVKGRVNGAKTVTITKNEILTSLNKPDTFILAIVLVDGGKTEIRYIKYPFQKEPDFGVTSVNYDIGELLRNSQSPS